ncbi:MAG: hypothetical protein ACYCU0_08365 [Solirubrobacteraceae bacterium]
MRLARSTGAGAGVLIILLGIWGALIPFVGPYFNYGFGPDVAWHFSTNRLWLDILPGAAAILGGLGLIGASRRVSGVTGGWVAIAAGAWFLVGPSMSMLWGHAAPGALHSGIGAPLGGHDRAAIEAIGFFYGLGAVIVALAAFASGRFASRPALATRAVAAGAQEGRGEREPLHEPALSREPVVRRGSSGNGGRAAGREEAPAVSPGEPARRP